MYKLVIFDLDGTLVNSLADLANACNEALSRFGFPTHELDKYRYFVGDGIPMLINRILPEEQRSDERINDVKAVFDEIYSKSYDKLTRPYDGMEKLLDDLLAEGIKISVASNKADEFTQKIIRKTFGDRFSYVSGKKPEFDKKPDPGIVFHIMEKLGAAKEETVFVGDSSVDMKTAANAGIDSIGCTWGFRTIEELRENKASYIAEKPADIFDIVTK